MEYKLGLREKGYFEYSYLEVEDFIFNLFYKDLDFAFTIEAEKKLAIIKW